MALIGDNVFVTGAGQGVGRAVALTLVAKGARTATLVGRKQCSLDSTAEELRRSGCRVHTVSADLTDVAECKRAVCEAQDAFGTIDIICNCAGNTDRGTILDTSPEGFDRIFATNVRSTFFILQSALPAMIAQKSGVIINMSSMLAYGGVPYLTAYSASKAALNTLTRNVANAVKCDHIRVHAINLGWTVTPAEDTVQRAYHHLPENWAEIEGAKQPFGRLLTAEDPALLCAFLASEDAVMMTGTVIDMEQYINGTTDIR